MSYQHRFHSIPAALAAILAAVSIAFTVPSAKAEGTIREQALALTFDDSAVEWGPCPAFMPKGCELAVLHGDAAKPNADIFLKVPSESTLPHHWHTSAERMILVSGELHVTYDGQGTQVLKRGSYGYVPAKLPHTGFCAKGDPCVLFIAFEGPVDAVPAAAGAK